MERSVFTRNLIAIAVGTLTLTSCVGCGDSNSNTGKFVTSDKVMEMLGTYPATKSTGLMTGRPNPSSGYVSSTSNGASRTTKSQSYTSTQNSDNYQQYSNSTQNSGSGYHFEKLPDNMTTSDIFDSH